MGARDAEKKERVRAGERERVRGSGQHSPFFFFSLSNASPSGIMSLPPGVPSLRGHGSLQEALGILAGGGPNPPALQLAASPPRPARRGGALPPPPAARREQAGSGAATPASPPLPPGWDPDSPGANAAGATTPSCPVCAKPVALAAADAHVDACLARAAAARARTARQPRLGAAFFAAGGRCEERVKAEEALEEENKRPSVAPRPPPPVKEEEGEEGEAGAGAVFFAGPPPPPRPPPFTLTTCLVGRVFLNRKRRGGGGDGGGAATAPAPGEAGVLERQPGNAADPAATLVVSASTAAPLGFLPRALAAVLAPLLDDEEAEAGAWTVTVLEGGGGQGVPVALTCGRGPSREAAAALTAAAAAAGGAAAPPPSRHPPRLLETVATACASALAGDAHLFTGGELEALAALAALAGAGEAGAVHLFARLAARPPGAWHRLGQGGDGETATPAAARLLTRAGLAVGLVDDTPAAEVAAAVGASLTAPELRALALAAGALPTPASARAARREGLVAAVSGAITRPGRVGEVARRAAVAALAGGGRAVAADSGSGRPRTDPLLAAVAALRSSPPPAAPPAIRAARAARAALHRASRALFLCEWDGSPAVWLRGRPVAGGGPPTFPCPATAAAVRPPSPAFPDRGALLAYEAALAVGTAVDAALLAGDAAGAAAAAGPALAALASPAARAPAHRDWPAASPSPHPAARLSAPHIHALVASVAVSLLERAGRWGEAAETLRALLGGAHAPGRAGGWAVRLVTDLAHAGREEEALEAGEAALADSTRIAWGARLALQRAVLRLGRPPRRWRVPPWAPAARREPAVVVTLPAPPLARAPRVGVKSAFLGGSDGGEGGGGGPAAPSLSVEAFALRHYLSPAGGGWGRGEHAEGGAWASLFALLVGCPPAPGRPTHLDWGTPAFYPPRAAAVEAALAAVAGGGGPAAVLAAWERRGEETRPSFLPSPWARFDGPTLASLAACVGGPGLAAILGHLARGRGGGMPDLVLWSDGGSEGGGWGGGGAPGRCLLVEVKGPRDRLSESQRAWIAALEDASVGVEVLRVVEKREAVVAKH